MRYRVTWKRKNTTYTEYLLLDEVKHCLDFIENHDDYELISITPDGD